jgi:DNA modification methylase
MKYPCLLTKKINEISSAKYNPRKITDEAMGRLTKSLAEFGNIQPITWNVRTGNVVGGHQRLKVYKAMGKTEVDVWAVDLDEQKEKAANIALNKLSGEFDMPMLKDILEEIDTGDLDMEITGFGMDEIALMMEDAHPEVTEDEVPEVPVDAITKPGDLWLLGEHRVLCGDSTSEADVSRLMNGEKTDMVFTDPPYNIGFGGTMSSTSKNGILQSYVTENAKHRPIENDKKTESEFYDFICKILSIIQIKCDGAWYMSFGSANLHELLRPITDLGIEYKSIIIWVKNQSPMGGGAYRRKYEPIIYGNFSNKFYGKPYAEDDVWEFDRTHKNDLHPTMKPVDLIANAINHGSLSGCSVLDLFLGSGSTLIAAEQLGRKCYGMEISPNYCDVIVKRWENLTGKKATLAK